VGGWGSLLNVSREILKEFNDISKYFHQSPLKNLIVIVINNDDYSFSMSGYFSNGDNLNHKYEFKKLVISW